MKQNNYISINIDENNINNMKEIIAILFKEKKIEEMPKVTIQQTKPFTPSERERFNQWCRDLNVSALWDDNKLRLG